MSVGRTLLAAALAVVPVLAAAADAPDFVREVKPILVQQCLRCHAEGLAQGQLRLDTAAAFRRGGLSGSPVVPGDPARSLLYTRLVHADPAKRMPWLSEPLAAREIDAIRRWIDAGAPWPEGEVVSMEEPAATAPVAGPAAVPTRPPASGPRLSFNKDVRPILAANCYACHGPDRNSRQAGLRLDREDAAKAKLPSGQVAVVPGRPDESALVQRIADPDEARRMPHVSSGRERLTAAEAATLRRWITEGADWEAHWAYIPPRRPALPAVRDSAWPKNAVDAFVLAGIESAGVKPSPEARPAVLLRRLSFDLLGLPPTAGDLDRFLGDSAPGAYERAVDRLLASPAFGERMAAFWLDLVRYADSAGYHSDNARTVWRYRDYVVDAFNENVPFDRFTAEQIAGDLLPGSGTRERIASGYNRLLQTTEEGGAQPKEYRAIYLADRVRNVSTVWMGATVGCAQCHDHKFDPYLARDFYSLGAFFADVKEKPVGRRDPDYLPDAKDAARLARAEAEVERAKKAFESRPTPEELALWEKSLSGRRPVEWTTLEPVEARSANGTRVLIQGNDFSLIATTAAGPKPARDTYTVRFKTALSNITGFRLEALTFDELPRGGPGRGALGDFVVSEVEVRDGADRPVALRHATASTPPAADPALAPAAAIDGRTDTGGWRLAAADGESHRLVMETEAPQGAGPESTFTLVVHQNAGEGRSLGRFRLSATTSTSAIATFRGPDLTKGFFEALALDPDKRNKDQKWLVEDLYRRITPQMQALRSSLRAAVVSRDALRATLPQSLVTTTQEPDVVRILPRGNWLVETGEVVLPAVPRFLQALATQGPRASRLDLARWLTAAENPLTSRVFMNRLFRLYFGEGLSRTLDDLGSQGEWPTHPELLDWLAVEFVEKGWDVKHMVRTLVTSATYRQSSDASREALERDPDNRLLARQARFRLDAEMVRDGALRAAGLLSERRGGPGVFPYQPRGYWSFLNYPPREWDDSAGDDQHRRALYTWWQRTFPQPSLLAFDAPSREECVGVRTRSNVPQQALVLMNDPTYVEAAVALAGQALAREGTFGDRVSWAYHRALSRRPRAEELAVLAGLFEKERARYASDPEAARALTGGTGEAAEWAAFTAVTRAILNLPEMVTRS